MELLHKFKEKLIKGDSVIGPFMKTSDPGIVETAGYAGFDFAILDREHGPGTIENMQNLVRAAMLAKITPIIRIPDGSETSIGKALDIGALGIQVPQVQTAREAEGIIKKAKFYPRGERGVCRFVRAAQYSAMDRKKYFQSANETLVILQIEGQKALNNIDEILDVEGVDILFIGPYDLSQSLGVPGEVSHPDVINKMIYMVEKARKKNVVIGTFIDETEAVSRWKNAGVQYLSYSVDVGIFLNACKKIVNLNK